MLFMPLKITNNREQYILGPEPRQVTTHDGVLIFWSGDGPGQGKDNASSYLNGEVLGNHTLNHTGSSTTISYKEFIPPIEAGEPTTQVTRKLRLERI